MLTGPPRPFKLHHAHQWIETYKAGIGCFVIEAQDVPVGVVSVISDVRGQDLGYWLAEHAWGHGYMTEAAKCVLAWHFARSDQLLTSGHIFDNPMSRKILLKLGFVDTHVVHDYCAFRDAHVELQRMEMTADRWHSLRTDAR